MSDKLQALRLDFTSCLPSMSDYNLEPASLLASLERTPHVAQYYSKFSETVKAHLSHGRYIEAHDFAPVAQILLTTRCGGLSVAPYDSFNVAHHVEDKVNQVMANRQLLLKDLGCQHLCFMEQTHSKRIGIISTSACRQVNEQNPAQAQNSVQAQNPSQGLVHAQVQSQIKGQKQAHLQVGSTVQSNTYLLVDPSSITPAANSDWEFMSIHEPLVSGLNCDGLVTSELGIALAVMTADCLPLLLCEPEARVVGAIHCGWKGLQLGIVKNAVQAMEHLGANPAKMRAVMGAAIGPRSFEVGPEVKAAFEHMSATDVPAGQDSLWTQDCFIAEQDEQGQVVQDRFLLNLYQLCQGLLQASGVLARNIRGGEFDTRMQSEIFYSYRVSKVTGRLASIVCINA